MQKKKIILIRNIAIIAILAIIIIALGLIITKKGNLPQTINEEAKAEYTTQIGTQTYDITNAVTETPNLPKLSAGMIPVKLEGKSWVITSKEDTEWYNYEEGKPAYMMLNDGTYQSEIQANMANKKLAGDNVGVGILDDPINTMGSIYMWIPRFAYNSEGEIIYIKQSYSVAETWDLPEIFIYETEKRDFSLSGIWIEYNPLANASEVKTKVKNMQGEENKYGFIANTIGINANDEATYLDTINTFVEACLTSARDPVIEPTNTNRTILKITNAKQPEPIKGIAYYDETEEKIKIEVTYNANEISKILDSKGNILSENSLTADSGDEIIGNKVYKYIIIDNLNNQKTITVEVSGLDVYIIENEADLKFFRDVVNSGKATEKTKAYQIADVKMNEGKYTIDEETGDITFANDAEQWETIGKDTAQPFKSMYDGQGYIISGVYINSSNSYVGLFGYGTNCTIRGITLKNSSIKGYQMAGGIIGSVVGTKGNINNCGNYAQVNAIESKSGGIVGNIIVSDKTTANISNCYNYGKITGKDMVGGIAGYGYSINGKVEVKQCYNKGIIEGENSIGGIVGNTGHCNITYCYNMQLINGSASHVGGIVGNNYANIAYCYNTGNVTGNIGVGGITRIQ